MTENAAPEPKRARAITPAQVKQLYGPEVASALKAIRKGQPRLKRLTLLALADAMIAGETQLSAFQLTDTATRRTHYRWLKDDPAYHAAHTILIGSEEEPGLARQGLMAVLDAESDEALLLWRQAGTLLKTHTSAAVRTLIESLSAQDVKVDPRGGEHVVPDNAARLRAALAIIELTAGREQADKDADKGDKPLRVELTLPSNNREQAQIFDGDEDTDYNDEDPETR